MSHRRLLLTVILFLLLSQNTSQLCCGDEWFDKNLSRLRDTPLLAVGRGSFLFVPKVYAASLDSVNQKVCDRFEEDLAKMAAIMEELRRRKGIKETRVAFGGIDTPIKSADYWVTFAAEAVAFERGQKYATKQELRYSLEVLKGKVLKAKTEIGKVLNED